MKSLSIVNRTRQSVLGTDVAMADRWWQRARGFLRRPEPKEGEGLLLSPCRAVHMLGMTFPLDIVFVDRHGRVLALYPGLRPGRRSAWHGAARYALELRVGTIEATRTEVGDLVAWLPARAESSFHAYRDEGVRSAGQPSDAGPGVIETPRSSQ